MVLFIAVLLAFYCEHCQTACDNFSLHDHAGGDLQGNIGEIPDIFHAERDQLIGDLLGGGIGDANYGDLRRISGECFSHGIGVPDGFP